MGQLFAVCANEMSPADGRVVTLTYGCGAHSEVLIVPPPGPGVLVGDLVDVEGDDPAEIDEAAPDEVAPDEVASDEAAADLVVDDDQPTA
jgi:hypothetical protein